MNYPFCIVGLDIGGTKIAGGLCVYKCTEEAPQVLYNRKRPSQAIDGAEFLINNTLEVAKSIIADAKADGVINEGCPVVAVGAGSPGRCEKSTSTIMTGTCNFPGYKGTCWSKIFKEELGLPCGLLNDVQSHTLGEARWGSGAGKQNVVLLAFGTGVGGAAVVNGQIMLGSHGYAGELGHFCSDPAHGYDCTCGKSGHLEAVGAGSGIEMVYEARTGNKITGPEISKRAYEDDTDAEFCIKLAGQAAGCTIAQCQTIFDPEVIIITGSVTKAGKMWRDALQQGLKKELVEELLPNVNMQPALLGDNAPIIGAAEYAKDKLKLPSN